jgi:hypothetical protein
MISKLTIAHKFMKIYCTHHIRFFYMFRPLMLPSSGRFIATDRHIEILLKFSNDCTDIKYWILKLTHGLMYVFKIKIRIKYLWLILMLNKQYMCYKSPSFLMLFHEDGHMSGNVHAGYLRPQTLTQNMQYLLLLNGNTKVPQCYVISVLAVMYKRVLRLCFI